MSSLSTIGTYAFLRSMPASVVCKLDELTHLQDFPPGSAIFAEGTEHAELYLVLHGHVRLDMAVPKRGRIPLMTLGEGDLLGWSPLVGDCVMTSTATALDSVRTLTFRGSELRRLCEQDHDVGYYVMRQVSEALSRRLVATRLQLLDLFADHVAAITADVQQIDDQC